MCCVSVSCVCDYATMLLRVSLTRHSFGDARMVKQCLWALDVDLVFDDPLANAYAAACAPPPPTPVPPRICEPPSYNKRRVRDRQYDYTPHSTHTRSYHKTQTSTRMHTYLAQMARCRKCKSGWLCEYCADNCHSNCRGARHKIFKFHTACTCSSTPLHK